MVHPDTAQTVNVYTGALARGWIWADGSPLWAGTSPFPNMCLPPEEEVVTSHGLVPIADVKAGDLVLTHRGRFQRVLQTFVRPYRGKLLSINGIKMTPEHPVLTRHIKSAHGRGMCLTELWAWTEAKDLTVESYGKQQPLLFLPRVSEVVDRGQYDGLPVDPYLMTVVGYYLSEGRVSLDERHTDSIFVLGYSMKELQRVNELVIALKSIGLNPRVYFKKDSTRVEVASRRLATFLEMQFGKGARDKHIPSWVKNLPSKKLQPVFDCYMNGDGHVRTNDRIVFHCGSRRLIFDLRDVALKLGYTSTVPEKPGQETEVRSEPQYYGAVYTDKQDGGVRSDRDGIYPRVKSISETEYAGFVHNLSVGADNSFCTRRFAVHNCDIVVTGELGYKKVSDAQSSRLAHDQGVQLLLDLQARHGWQIYQELFRHTKAEGIEDWRAFPEPVRSSMIVWFLSFAAGEDLLPRFNRVIGSISGSQIPLAAYRDVQRSIDLRGVADR